MILPLSAQTEQTKKRLDSNYYVEGYAARYEPYMLWEDEDGPIYEEFVRGCFDNCDMSDVIMQFDHVGKVLARQRNKTLIVEADDIGLFTAADLSKSEAARGMYEEISNGLIDRMSWGFIPGVYEWDEKTRTIRHYKVKKIFDVSAVSMPANDTTIIQARSFVDGVIRQRTQELRRAASEKAKTLLKIKLGGL